MNILVTGAAGFLGYHMCLKLLKKGYTVYGVDSFITGQRENIAKLKENEYFFFKRIDVSSMMFADYMLDKNFSYVFHFASPASPKFYKQYPFGTMEANTTGLKNILFNCKSARVIFASTSEVYGDPMVSPQREDYLGNVNSFGERSCYDESKRMGEAIVYWYNKLNKTKHGVVRIFNTYGPNMRLDDGRAIPSFICAVINREKLKVFGNGNQTRSFCYVSDTIEGIYRYAVSDIQKPMNIGNPNEEISIKDLAKMMSGRLGYELVKNGTDKDDPKTRKPDIEFAKRELFWTPEVSLEEGIAKTIAHYTDERIDKR